MNGFEKIIITGGAGFIGSHLVDRLADRCGEAEIIVLDSDENNYKNKKAAYMKKDIVNDGIEQYFEDAGTVFHLAADPMVNVSAENPKSSFDSNVIGTFNVLEACRKKNVKRIMFTSSSTVYGEAKKIPTPEEYPCEPISNYGASKLACEGYLSSYAHSYGIMGTVLRLANIFGERSMHGVMYDFFHKLKKNNNALEILGDGKQDKSYLHVSDCIDGLLLACEKQKKIFECFNMGSEKKITVNEIAKIMCQELCIDPKFTYTGGKRGWVGDVPLMLLDCKRLKKLGWKETTPFVSGVKKYLEWMNREY